MYFRYRLIKICALLLWVLIAPAFANADEGATRFDLTAADTPEPLITASTSDGGLWVVASASWIGGKPQHQLLRLDADGNRTAALLLPNNVDQDNADKFALFPLADGGVLELDTGSSGGIESRCLLRSITREGVVRFERNVRQSNCKLKLSKSSGAPYLISNIDAARLVSEDGSLASSFVVPGDVSLIAAEFVGADREVLLMTRFPSGSGYVFSRMAENGAVRWSKPLEGISGNLNIRVRGLSDGRAMILIFDVSKVQQRFYSADGALIETREIAMPESKSSGASNWAQDGQGNQAFVLRFGTGSVDDSFGAMLFAQNGSFIKLVRYTLTDQCLSNCELLGLASGFAIAVRTQDGARLVLTSPLTNVANVEVALPGNFGARITNGRDDSILIAGGKSLRAVNASGVAVPAPSLVGKGIEPRTVLGSAIAENGKSFALLRDYTDGEFRTQLEAFDANRQKIWQATTGNVFNETPLLVADELRACVG